MALIHDLFTASNVAGYYTELPRETMVGEQYFPAKKQLGDELTYVKGAEGKPVVLRASAYDTKVTLRDRINIEMDSKKMPFFKEARLVKEEDRQMLNLLEQTHNQEMIDVVSTTIFNDQMDLVKGAHARLEAMRMQLLAYGVIYINSDGVFKELDYGVAEENKGVVKTAWTDPVANPVQDLDNAVEALKALGTTPEVLVMNSVTFVQLRKAPKTAKQVLAAAQEGYVPKRTEVEDYLLSEYGLRLLIDDRTFVDDDGVLKKYYPDGKVTLTPNMALGSTVFGTTPEESDLVSGNNLNVSIVDTGIAVTTKTTDDPVNTQTKVSMVALPSFEQINRVYMLDVTANSVSRI